MPYKCVLTNENKFFFRELIRKCYKDVKEINSISAFVLFLCWIFEYFCAYHFIPLAKDEETEDVTFKAVEKRTKVKKRKLMNLLQHIRNQLIHTPYAIDNGLCSNLATITEEETLDFCYVFEEDATEFSKMLFDVLQNFPYDLFANGQLGEMNLF